jgi:hypothetical protein
MNVISYPTLRKFIEDKAGMPLNVDLFWGQKEKVVYPPKRERVYFRLFKNLQRTSHKGRYHKKDNGHTIMTGDVEKYVHHFQKVGVFPLGAIKVIP